MRKFLFVTLLSLSSLAQATSSQEPDAKRLIKAGRFVQAESVLKDMVREEPNNTKYLYWLSQTEERNGERVAALADLKKAFLLDPSGSFGSGESAKRLAAALEHYVDETSVKRPTQFQPVPTVKQASGFSGNVGLTILAVTGVLAAVFGIGYLIYRKYVNRQRQTEFLEKKSTLLSSILKTQESLKGKIDLESLSTKADKGLIGNYNALASELLSLLVAVKGRSYSNSLKDAKLDRDLDELDDIQHRILSSERAAANRNSPPKDAFEETFGKDVLKGRSFTTKRVPEPSSTKPRPQYVTVPTPTSPPVQEVRHYHESQGSSLGDVMLASMLVNSMSSSHAGSNTTIVNNYERPKEDSREEYTPIRESSFDFGSTDSSPDPSMSFDFGSSDAGNSDFDLS